MCSPSRAIEFLNGIDDRISLPAVTHHIRFLANQYELGRDDVASLGPSAIQILSVLELALRAEVVLREHFRIGLKLRWIDGVTRNAVEDLGYSRDGIGVVRRNRLRLVVIRG